MNTVESVYMCPACNVDYVNAASLNKHLSNCLKFPEWVKTYVPKYFNCNKCDMQFINNECLLNHQNTCSN